MKLKLLSPDVNIGGGSSPSTASAASSPQDVNENQATSSSEGGSNEEGVKSAGSIQDIVAGIKAKHGIDQSASSKSASPSAESGSVRQSNKTEEEGKTDDTDNTPSQEATAGKEGVTQEEKEEKENEETNKQRPSENVPYARFKEKVDAVETLTTTLTQQKPLVERYSVVDAFLKKHAIPDADLNETLGLMALAKTKPEEFLSRLESITTNLKIQLGKDIPADLKARVDAGEMSDVAAKELAKARLDATNLQRTREQETATQRQSLRTELIRSINSWGESKAKTDLEFKPKPNATAADGKYEMVMAQYSMLWNTRPVYSVSEAVALLEEAYRSVDGIFRSRSTPPPTRKPRLTSSASTTTKADAKIDPSKPGWGRQVLATLGKG